MAPKDYRKFRTFDPIARLTALALLLGFCRVYAESVCTLSLTSSTTLLQQTSLDTSCSGAASVSAQPHVWIHPSLNRHLTNLTGVTSLPAPSNNALGLVTFNGTDTLIFDSITTTNVQIPEESTLSSLVWFVSEANVVINSWTSRNSACPGASKYGLIHIDTTNTDHISLRNVDTLCSPPCLTISGTSNSVQISNSTFQYDHDRSGLVNTSTAAVWANLTGTFTVTNSRFTEFTTDYGALSVHATNVTISGCSFSKNTAKAAGGALFITGTGRWGALGPQETAQALTSTPAADSCWVWIKDSSFLGNSVHGTGGGGALDIVNMGNIIITGSKFHHTRQ